MDKLSKCLENLYMDKPVKTIDITIIHIHNDGILCS